MLLLPLQETSQRLSIVFIGRTDLDVRDSITAPLLAHIEFVPRPVLSFALVTIAHLWIHHRHDPINVMHVAQRAQRMYITSSFVVPATIVDESAS